MNREYVLDHLREALEELERTIKELQSDPEYDDGEFLVAMQHLYGHLNTAWNARSASAERLANLSQADFDAWRTFPTDLDLSA